MSSGADDHGGTHTDTDPSHYYGTVTGGIDIEKATNGVDADTPTGPMIPAGDTVTSPFEGPGPGAPSGPQAWP